MAGVLPSAYTTAFSTPRERTPQRQDTDKTLRASASPQPSYRSVSATDMSDTDYTDEGLSSSSQQPEKRRWRFSHSVKHKPSIPTTTMTEQDRSRAGSSSTTGNAIPSGGSERGKSRSGSGGRSLQTSQELSPPPAQQQQHASSSHPVADMGASPPEGVLSDSDDRKKGPMSWIRGKIAERKEKEAERRARSPAKPFKSESRVSLHAAGGAGVGGSVGQGRERVNSRGKSLDVGRQASMAGSASSAVGSAGATVPVPSVAAGTGTGTATATTAGQSTAGPASNAVTVPTSSAATSATSQPSAVQQGTALVETEQGTNTAADGAGEKTTTPTTTRAETVAAGEKVASGEA